MIKLIQEGIYKLTEIKESTKVLSLDNVVYAFSHRANAEETLIQLPDINAVDRILSIGKYRIYDVKDEAKLTDNIHLELFVGNGIWQGYLLTTSLPKELEERTQISSTKEIISKSMEFHPVHYVSQS